jgi:hypothetical protein
MADFKVSQNSESSSHSVKLSSGNRFTISQEKTTTTVMAEFLSDLADVSVSNLPTKDNYVLAYDATLQKYTLVPADQVLQSAVEDSQLPQEFINQLDTGLDDRIDLDAGNF